MSTKQYLQGFGRYCWQLTIYTEVLIAGEICNSCAIPNCLNENCTEEFLCFDKPYLPSDCLEEECLNTSFPISFERVPGMHEEDLCKVGSILCCCPALTVEAHYFHFGHLNKEFKVACGKVSLLYTCIWNNKKQFSSWAKYCIIMTPLHSEEFIGFTRILLLLGLLYSIVEDSMMILKKQKYSYIHMTFSIVYPSIVH